MRDGTSPTVFAFLHEVFVQLQKGKKRGVVRSWLGAMLCVS